MSNQDEIRQDIIDELVALGKEATNNDLNFGALCGDAWRVLFEQGVKFSSGVPVETSVKD